MTNLLPPAAKKQIVFEYWMRVVCAWVILWSLCLVAGVALLWPTYVLLTGQSAAYEDSMGAVTERSQEFQELNTALQTTTKRAQTIIELSERPRLSELIQAVWLVTNRQTIDVTDIAVGRTADQLGPLTISGTAADRQSLAQFRDALVALSFVETVDLPIDNLAKNQDIDFSLTVNLINEPS